MTCTNTCKECGNTFESHYTDSTVCPDCETAAIMADDKLRESLLSQVDTIDADLRAGKLHDFDDVVGKDEVN